MLSTRRPLAALSLAVSLSLAGGVASAQTPLTFTIDGPASQFTFSGSTSLGPIVGNPDTSGLTGTLQVLLTTGATQPLGTIQFAPGGDALIAPDLNASIPNPVPFLPDLAVITITNLRLGFTSDAAPVDVTGAFTVNMIATALSGTATVTPLGGTPSMNNLTGTVSAPQAYSSTLTQTGLAFRIDGPLLLSFMLTDPGSGLTATIDIVGNLAADHVSTAPSNYCTAAANSTGAAGVIQTAGSTSLFAADLELRADTLPSNSLGYFLFADGQGFVPGFGGSQGNLCLGGAIFRLSSFVQNSGTGGQVALPLPFTGLPPGASFDPGDTWNFQYWFRDAVGGSATSNTTDGMSVTFLP